MRTQTSKKFRARALSQWRRPKDFRPQFETLENRLALATMIGLTSEQELIRFDSAAPDTIVSTVSITGLGAGESIQGIDSRPANGVIYGLSSSNLLYTLDASSGVATLVTSGAASFALQGQFADIDFNPTVDRLRIDTEADQNFRINPNTGAIVDGDAAGGIQPDTALAFAAGDTNAGINPNVTAVAYDRNFQGSTLTTLFGIDAGLNQLVRIGSVDGTPNSPNGGQLSTVGNLGLDVAFVAGFEITADGTAYASLTAPSGVTRLYTINLTTGAATAIDSIGDGSTSIASLTSATVLAGQIVYASTTGNRLVSFSASDPNTLLSDVPITGLNTGETIAGIDFRPLTNQLFALTSTNRVLIINPSTGAATAAGTIGGTFAAGPQGGFDFNPAADRLRLVNSADDNARYNPVTNTFVQDDADLQYIIGDPNNDLNPNVVASAYDRNDNNGATATTLFGIDSTFNILVRQGGVDATPSPNDGGLSTLGSLGVDPTDLVGFDIFAAGTLGNGGALAVMQLQGESFSRLFSINLTAGLSNQALGTATPVGTVGGGNILITAMAISQAVATTTVLTSSNNPSIFGESVTFTAVVDAPGAGVPTGTVTFIVDGGSSMVVPVDSTGQAAFATSTLTVGLHTVTADFTSDSSFFLNSSDSLEQIVNPSLPECEVETSNSPGASGTATLEDDADNPGNGVLIVTGTAGNDVIVIEPRPSNLSQIRVKINGQLAGLFTSTEVQHIVVFGLEGKDSIVVSAALFQPATILGGRGNDVIVGGSGDDAIDGEDGNDTISGGAGDDELCGGNGNDTVVGGLGNDLIGGDAGADVLAGSVGDDVLLGGDGNDTADGGVGNDRVYGQIGNDKLIGGVGNNILVGDDGIDNLVARPGRNLLIGGRGADLITGNGQGDILVAGSTAHDENDVALQAILAEWTSGNSYATRVSNIRNGGGANGAFVLNATTVIDDGVRDTLIGAAGQDWFWIGLGDRIKDRKGNEQVN